jgi:CRISPR-associated exonuclease Cas4
MKQPTDEAQRRRVLTELGSTLLVEAAAGTGKTSLLAGRVAMLLAEGHAPSSIAAITFTERAAAELRARVDKFALALIAGHIPGDLKSAFRAAPLSDDQRHVLAAAHSRLGDLAASTIHGFCLTILQSYAVEGRVDPGATVMDAEQTEVAFESVFDSWLSGRLCETALDDDPIVVMTSQDPARAVKTLRSLAKFRRAHPGAVPGVPPSYADAARDFLEAVVTFRRWIGALKAPADAVLDVDAFEKLGALLEPAMGGALSFSELYARVSPSNDHLLGKSRRSPYVYKQRLGGWRLNAGKDTGDRLSSDGRSHYDHCAITFKLVLGAIADALLAQFFSESDGLVLAFEKFKRDAAVLDFDDILIRTRNLLRDNRRVRDDVASRYRFILVDEFQDTDPTQCETLFLIGSEPGDGALWDGRRLRSGALFMVGDPKQAIYRFRGCDLKTYIRAKDAVASQFPGNILEINANFRSRKRILNHVDDCFGERLAQQKCGYKKFDATVSDDHTRGPAIARFSYSFTATGYMNDARDADARMVAKLCASIIGNLKVRRADTTIAVAAPGDIALLAPTSTDLWRYERELEAKGLAVSAQAGKNLYRRQEAQDFVALVRALADSRDTLALGAVLRGPLVGLTERELLNIAQSLRDRGIGPLTIRTAPAEIPHPLGALAVTILHDIWRKRRGTTPHGILSEAFEGLRIVASTAARFKDQRARGLSNLGSLMERARAYHVRGLKQLAVDLGTEWEAGLSFDEAPPDRRGDAIEIVTIHKAKGLEWPVVIPINLASMPQRTDDFFFKPGEGADSGTVHWTFGEIASSTLAKTMADDAAEGAQERVRQLYVACTRALDLLIIPAPSKPPDESWHHFFDLKIASLPEFELPTTLPVSVVVPHPVTAQSAHQFALEAARIEALPRISWRQPSTADTDRSLLDRATIDAPSAEDAPDVEEVVVAGAGPLRGIVLHKLMEELLVGFVAADATSLTQRASELVSQLSFEESVKPDPSELASASLRTFYHIQLDDYRAHLVPEIPLFGMRSENELVSARADAIAIVNGVPAAAFDWKSDADPGANLREAYRLQLLDYLSLCGAPTGAIVYMSRDPVEFDCVSLPPGWCPPRFPGPWTSRIGSLAEPVEN